VSQRGFTMIEALVSLAILGIALAGIVPGFFLYTRTNALSEVRSGSVAAAQRVFEALRAQDPADLPSSGASAAQIVPVGKNEFQVVTRYCVITPYCSAGNRHVVIEVSYGGRIVFTIESVLTQLR
jgi:prepilin-type N-terminal cleavage/methylation domain-containing protein